MSYAYIMMPLYNSYTCKNTILNFCLFKQTHKLADILRRNLMPMYGYGFYIYYNIKIKKQFSFQKSLNSNAAQILQTDLDFSKINIGHYI